MRAQFLLCPLRDKPKFIIFHGRWRRKIEPFRNSEYSKAEGYQKLLVLGQILAAAAAVFRNSKRFGEWHSIFECSKGSWSITSH